jgi:hypothetical protein
MSDDVVSTAARAAAERLSPDLGPGLAAEVETALNAQQAPGNDQYFDPVSLGSLIVSVVGLAWTIYTDLRKRKSPDPEAGVAEAVRAELSERGQDDPATQDKITKVIVIEVVKAAA